MVPVPDATGAMGSGRCCGHSRVCAGDSVSGRVRPAVRMLLQREPEEEDEGWGDLKACKRDSLTHTVK